MNILAQVLFFIVLLIGCKQEVNFTAQDSVPLASERLPNDNSSVADPAPIEEPPIIEVPPISIQPPVINIVKKPLDHLMDETTNVIFEIIKGDNPLSSIECLLDKKVIPCDFTSTIIEFSNLSKGDHEILLKVTDDQKLSDEVEASWKIYDRLVSHSNALNINSESSQTDILFVIDNSVSMHEEQQGIAKRINTFFDKIKDINWRLGIITTDPYEFDPVTKVHNPLADGVLLKFPNGNYVIDHKLDEVTAKKLFSETIYRPERGNGHERGIYNTYRSIERSQLPNDDVNKRLNQFYRPSAALSVVLISDENETLVNGVNAPLADLHKSDGENLIKFVKSTWGSKKLFQFNSVIVRPNDNFCIGADEKFGYAYYELSRATDGVVEDICASDYSGALKNIGSEVANLQKRYKLDCIPLDTDGNGQPNVEVKTTSLVTIPNYIVSADQIEFDKPLSNGNYQIQYFCSK